MNSFRRVILITMGVVLGASVGLTPYLNRIHAIEQRVQVLINNQIIIADISKTPEQRVKGLSGKKELNINEGMIFLFDVPQRYSFWMRGMEFPIDILWIRNEIIVGIAEYVPKPLKTALSDDTNLPLYYPPEDIDMALEIVAGRSRLLRARVGDKVTLKPFAPRIQ